MHEPLKFRVRFYFWTRLAAKRQAFVQLRSEAMLAVWAALKAADIRAPVDTLALVTTRSEDTLPPARHGGERGEGASPEAVG
jgi:hypothetical protein